MNDRDFRKLTTSVVQAGRIRRGEAKASRVTKVRPLDIKRIRQRLNRSQAEFALMIGVSIATLRNWEQGRRNPVGPARALLTVAASNPQVVARALGVSIRRAG